MPRLLQAGANTVTTDLTLREAAQILTVEPRKTNFVQDLLHYYVQNGEGISQGRANWIIVIAQQVLDRRNAPVPTTLNYRPIAQLFLTAKENGKKYPKITLRTSNGQPLTLSLAGPKSRYEGSINITDDRKYPDNTYYGRIAPDGTYSPSKDDTPDITDLLTRLSTDPVRTATDYGRATGTCCFCKAELTDERSISYGYGPVCSRTHGLPWGERPAEILAEPWRDDD